MIIQILILLIHQNKGQVLKKSMNNFVISIIGKKDKFYNKFLGKRISHDNSYVIFQIDSLADTSKNEQIKLFEAVNKLKYLSEKKWLR